eukprot:COSAG05_NODE_1303_length_5240_cov_2.158335_6_plen_80_part_00
MHEWHVGCIGHPMQADTTATTGAKCSAKASAATTCVPTSQSLSRSDLSEILVQYLRRPMVKTSLFGLRGPMMLKVSDWN